MVQKKDFDKMMSTLSDEELYDVLAHENNYIPEAIESAKSEIQSRNASPGEKTEFETITEEIKKEDVEPSKQMVIATTGQRLGNMFFDSIFSSVLVFVLGIILDTIGLAGASTEMNSYLLGIIIILIYYTLQEALTGRTLGKLITGTKAVNEDGSDLTFGNAVGRTLCRLIPFEAFSFIGGQGRPEGWHDRIPKTKVISM